jgi:hypothetical protein
MNVKYLLLLFVFVVPLQTLMAQDTSTYNTPAALDKANRPIHWEDPKTITNKMKLYEDSLVYFIDSVYYTSNYDNRVAGNYAFMKLMKGMLKQPNSFAYPFDSLDKKINIIIPKDKAFKIYQWELITKEGQSRYFGVLQMPNGTFKPMIDVSAQVEAKKEDTVLTDTRWYGASYYNILDIGRVGNSTAYFLIGANKSGTNSEKKVVECLTFDKNNNLVFGAPVFQSMVHKQPKIVNRFIAEYQLESHITLNYKPEENMIIYDHLESVIGDNAKRYTFVSDGTYDGLRWNGKTWTIIPNAVQVVPTAEGKAPIVTEASQRKELITPADMDDAPGKPVQKKKK